VRDEAPAATTGGFNGKECDRTGIAPAGIAGFNPRSGPISLVAAEIHLGLGQRASATAGCTATFKLRARTSHENLLLNQ
jgi:hypothetical protein